MFKHIIVTRFSVRFSAVQLTDRRRWLAERMELFERYCYPSVVAQSNQNFDWYLLVGEAEDVPPLRKYNRCIAVCTNMAGQATSEILSRFDSWRISTRLDSDDALHRDFVANVQGRFGEREVIIDFRNGINFNESDGEMRIRRFKNKVCSPFLSLVERGARGCYLEQHMAMGKLFRVEQVDNLIPLWAQIIHGTNIGNTFRGDPTNVRTTLPALGFEIRQPLGGAL